MTRISLYRNFAGRPFPASASAVQVEEDALRLREQVKPLGYSDYCAVAELSPAEKAVLAERQWLPKRTPETPSFSPFAVLTGREPNRHIRIRSGEMFGFHVDKPGRLSPEGLESALQETGLDSLENSLWAWEPSFGYLCSNPIHSGAGFTLKTQVHLPGIGISHQIEQVGNAARAFGLHLVAAIDQAGPTVPYFWLVLGESFRGERDAFTRFDQALGMVLDLETESRKKLWDRDSRKLADAVHRSLAMAAEARILPYGEWLSLASWIRLGTYTGIYPADLAEVTENLRVQCAPGHLRMVLPESAESSEMENVARAEWVRKALMPFAHKEP